MNIFRKFAWLGLGTIFLSGCVSFLPEETVASKKIVLAPQLTSSITGPKISEALIIEKPLMLGSLDSTRLKIILEDGAGSALADVIAGVEWSDRLPNLLQETFITLSERTEKFPAVGRTEERFYAPYRLQLRVTNFEVVKKADASMNVVVRLSAKLLHSQHRNVLGQKQFFWNMKVEEEGLQCIIKAFEKTLGLGSLELLQWTVSKARIKNA